MSDANALKSLHEVFARHAARTLLVLPDGKTVRYGEMWTEAEQLAHRLIQDGLAPGDRLLIRLENSPLLLRLYIACAIAGLVACPVDPALPRLRLAALDQVLHPKRQLDEAGLAKLLDGPAPPSGALPADDPERDFLVIYSSGTTGEAKGIVHSAGALVASALSFATLSDLREDSVIYHHFPMFYMAGIFNMFICPAVVGASIVIGPKFSPMEMLRFWELPKRCGVNHLTLTPTMAQSLSHLYRTDDALLAHLARYQAVISTSSVLYDSVALRFHQTFGVPLRSCYGVTEVGGSITLQSWADALACEAVGHWRPEVSIRAGSGPDAPAEILVRTPFMMKGYLSASGLSSPLDHEGYFHTGDLGYLRDGVLHMTARESDLVKKGGEFVSLPMIENLVLRCGQIAEAAMVAVPDPYWGNRLVLFYVPRAIATGNPEEIETSLQALFAEGLRKIERPDKLIPVPWLPKTAIGKTRKRDLIERHTI